MSQPKFARARMSLEGPASSAFLRDLARGSFTPFRSFVAGVVGAYAFLLLQLAYVLLVSHTELTSIWEVQHGALRLLPAAFVLGAIPGGLGGLLGRALVRQRVNPSLRARLQVAAPVAGFAAAVAWGVGGGRHLASVSARGGFAVVAGLGALLACLFFLPFVSRFLVSRRTRGTSGWVVLFGAVLLETINLTVLVRLYPAFHIGLSFAALVLAGAALVLFVIRGEDDRPPESEHVPRAPFGRVAYAVLAVFVGCALFFVPASRALSRFDNFRWVMSERSVTFGWVVRAMAMVAPPAPLDEGLAETPLGQRRPTSALDFRGRDILLISVDALRADHLGAYGYRRPVSPAMDELARTGVVFEAAYAPTPHTSYSLTSLMTGKYMRPLLLQGAGADSDLWATVMQAYDYRTAAFYPPAVFFIDGARFADFQEKKLGFEYAKVEFAEGDLRVSQVKAYLDGQPRERRTFTWVHLFGPHEPYEKHPRFPFGERDVDRYDSEIAAADETVGRIVKLVRARDPNAIVLLTADHGEEFGDHGGRYHGTSVYDEQVRVPLVISAPDLAHGRRIDAPVQTIDLFPTVLDGLKIPVPPRIRGRSLGQYLVKAPEPASPSAEPGLALAETDQYALLAEGKWRLICQRRTGACQLFDIEKDPGQKRDVSAEEQTVVRRLRERATRLSESHGKYESQGLRAEGRGWPPAIVLGISGDAQVAGELGGLLDDADVAIRRKAAELLFDLGTPAQAPALRLAMTREEDMEARKWLALALTRLGQGAPLVFDLLEGPDARARHLAALALAENGDDAGEEQLVSWFATDRDLEFEMGRRILEALARIRAKSAFQPLIARLGDVRLRPYIAETLAAIGNEDARPFLAARLLEERYQSTREPLARAIVSLGGDEELIVPLRRFLGVPDRIATGLLIAEQAGILEEVGGPKDAARRRLSQLSDSGVQVTVIVPAASGPSAGMRLIVRARSRSGAASRILVQPATPRIDTKDGELRARNQPDIDTQKSLEVLLPAASVGPSGEAPFVEVEKTLPASFRAKAGHHLGLELFAPGDVEISSLAVVPLREDLPPPKKEPWKRGPGDEAGDSDGASEPEPGSTGSDP